MAIFISQTKLSALKKTGVIKPDENGYYELVLGGLNTFNNSGAHYYTAESAKKLFQPGSILMRRVANGALRAEVGHPRRMPGEKLHEFEARFMDTDQNNVCAHIKALWLDEDYGKNHPECGNPQMVAIMGLVKPVAPKGDILKEQLESVDQNCCFSIRSFSEEMMIRGTKVRVLTDVFAFDMVNEGGITMANKWNSPATESINNGDMYEDVIGRVTATDMRQVLSPEMAHMSTESSRELASYALNKFFAKEISAQRKPVFGNWQ